MYITFLSKLKLNLLSGSGIRVFASWLL